MMFFVGLYIYSFSFGSLDFYYGRISSPKQNSLIIGNSRSAQGLLPSVFNSELADEYEGIKMYNFSFTSKYSPFGKAYYNSIVNKVDPKTTNGVFIISVDPGSISSNTSNPEDETLFDENTTFLANMDCFSCNPNMQYILFGQETFHKKIFLNKIRGEGFLHDDGWLEINVPMDSISVKQRIKNKLKEDYATSYKFSNARLKYLEKTILFLKKHGKVFLVRLPINDKIMERQLKSFPDFDEKILKLAQKHDILYKNFKDSSNRFQYVDGSHLYKYSAAKISKELASWIKTGK